MGEKDRTCAVCGIDTSKVGSSRFFEGKWYCNTRERNHFKEAWENDWSFINVQKISVLCPFDKTEIGDLVLNHKGGKIICPTCKAILGISWEDMIVEFYRKNK